jgi:putative lipoprotein
VRVLCTVLAALVVNVASACSRPAERTSLAGTTRAYQCADGYRFVARFEPERVWLFLGERTQSLPQIPSISGIHYTDGRHTLRDSNGEASIEVPGGSHARCVNRPAAVPWEEARLTGVDFRATGQGSTWSLEIDEGSGIVFDDGKSRSVFPPGKREGLVELSSSGSRSITIERTASECTNGATGERFAFRVVVKVDGEEYRGCGRELR